MLEYVYDLFQICAFLRKIQRAKDDEKHTENGLNIATILSFHNFKVFNNGFQNLFHASAGREKQV